MSRPTTKGELLARSAQACAALCAAIDALPAKEREAEFRPGTLNRNIRDVLGHLHHWHRLLLAWYEVGMAAAKPAMPAAGYTWAMTPALNRAIHARYAATSLRVMRRRFDASHAAVHALVERHGEAELFTQRKYAWTGSTSLASYLIAATVSHYQWALRLIGRGRSRGPAPAARRRPPTARRPRSGAPRRRS